jgi:hypothetical protein
MRLRLIGHAAALALATMVAGCDGSPTDSGRTGGLAPAEQVQAFLPAVVDAAERITPGLGNAQAAAVIGPQLLVLHDQLVRREAQQIPFTLSTLRGQLLAYGTTARYEDGAEITAIELVLDGVQRLLSGSIE